MLGLTSALSSSSEKEQNYALSFDGVNDYVDLGPSNGIITTSQDPVSFSCWVKTTTTSTSYIFSCQKGDGSSAFSVNLQTNGTVRGVVWKGDTAHSFPVSTTAVNDGNWHHVAVVAKDGSQKVYVDGSLEDEETNTMDLPTNVNHCSIGAHSAGTNLFYNGSLTGLAVYTVELDANAITSIYNAGRHHNLNTPIGNYSSTPSHYYALGYGLFDDKVNGVVHDQGSAGFQATNDTMTNTDWSLNPVAGDGSPGSGVSNGWQFGVYPTTNTLSGTTASWDSNTRVVTINTELGGDNTETQLYQQLTVEHGKVYKFEVECNASVANQFRIHGNVEASFNGGPYHSGSGDWERVIMIKRASADKSATIRCQRTGTASGSGIVTGYFKNFSVVELKGKPGLVEGATFVTDN